MGNQFNRKVAKSILLAAALMSASGQDEVQVRLIDSETGFAISSSQAQITGTELTRRPGGMIGLKNRDRSAEITVRVNGYEPFRPVLTRTDGPRPIEVQLHPLQPPPEFRPESLAALEGPGQFVVVGFVGDESTRIPLPGVSISSGQARAETNGRGFFSLVLREVRAPVEIKFSKVGYKSLVRQSVLLVSNSVKKYRVRLQQGEGSTVVDEKRFRQTASAVGVSENANKVPLAKNLSSVTVPANIRVGTGCGAPGRCSGVSIFSLEDYVKRVLPSEWLPGWNAESLKAGSVAARSYGAWFVAHPISSAYDICDTTACQVFDADSTQASTDQAVEATKSQVLVKKGTVFVVMAEFSAENNNAGCGDGKSGTKTTYPCIEDAVCTGATRNGHGRGMCQNGTHLWGEGRNANGTPALGGKRTFDWMLNHYYPDCELVKGTS